MTRSRPVVALMLVLASMIIGLGYVIFLHATPHPPDAVRVIPLLWLAMAAVGTVSAGRFVRTDRRSGTAWLVVVMGLTSILLALVFAASAVLGD